MANGIPVTLNAVVPTYVATSYASISGFPNIVELQFSGDAPPIDGSVALAFIKLNIAGVAYKNGAQQRLIYFDGSGEGLASITGVASPVTLCQVGAWSFVATSNDAND